MAGNVHCTTVGQQPDLDQVMPDGVPRIYIYARNKREIALTDGCFARAYLMIKIICFREYVLFCTYLPYFYVISARERERTIVKD